MRKTLLSLKDDMKNKLAELKGSIALSDIYNGIDKDKNIKTVCNDDKKVITFQENYGEYNRLYQIHKFVIEVLSSVDSAFERILTKNGKFVLIKNHLSSYLYILRSMHHLSISDQTVNPLVDLFYRAYRKIYLADEASLMQCKTTSSPKVVAADLFNDFIDEIRNAAKDEKFVKYQNDFNTFHDNVFLDIADYANFLYNKYYSMRAVRLNLMYKKDYPDSINSNTLNSNIFRLIEEYLKDGKSYIPFGFVWSHEHSTLNGFNLHVILLFEDSDAFDYYLVIDELTKCWANVAADDNIGFVDCRDDINPYRVLAAVETKGYPLYSFDAFLLAIYYLCQVNKLATSKLFNSLIPLNFYKISDYKNKKMPIPRVIGSCDAIYCDYSDPFSNN
jgi:hypothetical protein